MLLLDSPRRVDVALIKDLLLAISPLAGFLYGYPTTSMEGENYLFLLFN